MFDDGIQKLMFWPAEGPMYAIEAIKYAMSMWNNTYGLIRIKEEYHIALNNKKQLQHTIYEFVTGGWCDNESIIYALQENYIVWGAIWESSHSGGLHIFKVMPV